MKLDRRNLRRLIRDLLRESDHDNQGKMPRKDLFSMLGMQEEEYEDDEYYDEEEGFEGKEVSDTLFFMKSAWGVKNNKWDHVGFILSNDNDKEPMKMKDMSGHRWPDQVEPIVSTWQDLMKDKKFWKNSKQIPQSPREAEEMGIYKTMKLPQTVEVPDGIICRTNDPEKKSENCGSFVFNVLANAGMDPSFLKSDEYLVVGKQF